MTQGGWQRLTAVHAFLTPTEVSLSGCPDAVMPVEVRIQGGGGDRTHRYAYFTVPGFAFETQVSNHVTGNVSTHAITALRAEP